MTYVSPGRAALDYFPCRYGYSKLLFRGPRRRLRDGYVVYLGSTETYGKFIETPFPMLTEHATGIKSVNLGCVNAGVDAYSSDFSLIDICATARVTVIELMGAQNMSNRFYAVHPRRNDRFLRASSKLTGLFPEVDFTEFNFTRHMLTALARLSADRFVLVREELQQAWVARMQSLIGQIDGKVILLRLSDHPLRPTTAVGMDAPEPLFIDRAMVTALLPLACCLVDVVARQEEIRDGLDEMVFSSLERPAAKEMLGPVVHRRAAAALASALSEAIEIT